MARYEQRPPRDLMALLSRVCDGLATPEEMEELAATAALDERVRLLYMETMADHAGIEALLRRDETARALAETPSRVDFARVFSTPQDNAITTQPRREGEITYHANLGVPRQDPGSNALPSNARNRVLYLLARTLPEAIHPDRHRAAFLAAAALCTAVFCGVLVLLIVVSEGRYESVPRRAKPRFIATITHIERALWAQGQSGLQLGTRLFAGQRLELEKGLVHLVFRGGARVVIEGPAKLHVDTTGAMTLDEGKLLAHVSKQAVGFKVETPDIDVVDLGTEFGVHVREEGTQLQVFKGKVQAYRHGDAKDQGRLLVAGQATAFGNSPQQGFLVKEKKMNRAIYLSLATVLAMNTPVEVHAAVITWTGATDNAWETVTNWDTGAAPVPGTDSATINGAFTADFTGLPVYTATGSLELLGMNIGGGATVNISGNMDVIGPLNIFNAAVTYATTGGTINQTGGTVNMNSLADPDTIVFQGNGSGNSSIYNLSGGSLTLNNNINFNGVNGATAQFNMSGGALDMGAIGMIGFNTGSNIFNFTGGTVTLRGGNLGGSGMLIFDGNGAGLQMNFSSFNQSIVVGNGTLKVVGDSTIDQINQGGSINDKVIFGPNSTYEVVINNTGDQFLELAATSGFGHDFQLDGTLNVTHLGGFGQFDILKLNTAVGGITGTFSTINLPAGFSVLDDGSVDGTFTIFAAVPVPEPSTALLLGVGGMLVIGRRRRLKIA